MSSPCLRLGWGALGVLSGVCLSWWVMAKGGTMVLSPMCHLLLQEGFHGI